VLLDEEDDGTLDVLPNELDDVLDDKLLAKLGVEEDEEEYKASYFTLLL
jgi:hypothetical protein